MSTLSHEALLVFPGCETSKEVLLSDIVVWSFSQWLPQSYLQRHEGPHGHMEEDLPNIPQFIQIHVGQTDECQRQEGFTVPPHREIGKQVALERSKTNSMLTTNTSQQHKAHFRTLFLIYLSV